MDRILLTIEYDGRDFVGWQSQPNLRSVQGELQTIFSEFFSHEISLDATGRTDKGVHAHDQKAAFSTELTIPIDKLARVLNGRIMKYQSGVKRNCDIRIIDAKLVKDGYNPRFDALGKTYKYVIKTDENDVFSSNYAYYVSHKLDLELLKAASEKLVGRHDFKAFENANANPKLSTIRTIYDIDIKTTDSTIEIYVTGDGFLYNMVRIIVGTLVDIASHRLDVSSIDEAFDSMSRSALGHTAPPEGLYMHKVYLSDNEADFQVFQQKLM